MQLPSNKLEKLKEMFVLYSKKIETIPQFSSMVKMIKYTISTGIIIFYCYYQNRFTNLLYNTEEMIKPGTMMMFHLQQLENALVAYLQSMNQEKKENTYAYLCVEVMDSCITSMLIRDNGNMMA